MKTDKSEDDIVKSHQDTYIQLMLRVVAWNVKFLAFLMVLVILWATSDVVYHLYSEISYSSTNFFNIDDLIGIFGTFMGVLIAIEVFMNIIFYLRKAEIHVPLVVSTALTAIARKIIILDYTTITPTSLLGIAAIIAALGVTLWLIGVKKA